MHKLLETVISQNLPTVSKLPGRNLQMPGDPRYQPEALKPFLGYDMWASFLIIVEWFWLMTLAEIGFMPRKETAGLTRERLLNLLENISTTVQDAREYGRDGRAGTNHDILALLELMKRYLPKALHKYLHLGATSYNIINTAYALILAQVFQRVFKPKLLVVDQVWRDKISQYAEVVQAGRTHLQTALPVTVGFWLACLHYQFRNCVQNAYFLSMIVPGSFNGAVGTSAALLAMLGRDKAIMAQETLMKYLDLERAEYTTQISPPQNAARFYFELLLLSGVLGNLGEDVRILQSSEFGEIVSATEVNSSSSTMAHKKANPIKAENNCGMHVNVIAEVMKVALTLTSDLQRDLRWSCVMRSFSSAMVYAYQQISTTERLIKSLAVDPRRVKTNFRREAKLVVAELLHLCLQRQGYAGTHELVNKTIVPAAAAKGISLPLAMRYHLQSHPDKKLEQAWRLTPASSLKLLKRPGKYIGRAIELAKAEAKNKLEME